MLSGMNVKPTTITEAQMQAFLDSGKTITTVVSKTVKPHSGTTKSHRFGGRWSSYNVGGNNRIRAQRRSS